MTGKAAALQLCYIGPKFKIEVQILDEWRRMFLGDWNPLGA